MVVPAQPYPYPYPYPGYPPRPVIVVPAPPMSSNQWTASIDALFLERSSGGSTFLGFTAYNPGSGMPPAVATANLYSDDVDFPLQAGIRLEVSHKITDYFTISATYWGLQQWSVGNSIPGDPIGESVLAYSPYLQLSAPPPNGISGFDTSLGYTYASQVENVEINALFRLNSDTAYWQFDWLVGARYVNLADQFTLTGIDGYTGAEENLAYNTTNNLVGVQTGLLLVRGWERFEWETGVKAGLMANIYRQNGSDTISGLASPPPGFSVSDNGTGVAALFEVSVAAGPAHRLSLFAAGLPVLRLSPAWPWRRGSSTPSATAATSRWTGCRSDC